MSEDQSARTNEVRAAFSKALNRHGYGFQYAVLKKCGDVAAQLQKDWARSTWMPLASEFPVVVQGVGTKADFVLSRVSRKGPDAEVPCFLLAECKRANPALSNWCFAQAPYVHQSRSPGHEPLIVERLNLKQSTAVENAYSVQRPYHIGIEVRSSNKGDAEGESGRAIEDAASQVLRGVNGFVEMLARNPQLLAGHPHAYILPVVFTTANLWGSEVSLSESDLQTGISNVDEKDFKSVDWLCYQYHVSPGLKHSLNPLTRPSSFGALMQSEYIRTIPIVNAEGIEPFFTWISNVHFD